MSFDVTAIRKHFPSLAQTARNGVPLHYLDNAATTQLAQSALDAYIQYEMTARANVQRGSHYLAERASDAYAAARVSVGRYLNAESSREVVFTSGATASINLLAAAYRGLLKEGDEVLVSAAEHHSNFLPWQRLCQESGAALKVLPILPDGTLDMAALPSYVSDRCQLIAITHCSNVTGNITDVASIVRIAKSVGAQVLLDGAQMAQHGPVDVQALGIDYYVFSGHKCFAPNGVGVFWAREELLAQLPPFQVGGGMVNYVDNNTAKFASYPHQLEAGTPPIAQAVALAAALEWMQTLDWVLIAEHEKRLFDRAIAGLQTITDIRLLGRLDEVERHSLISFTLPSIHPHDICHILDEQGIALRGGHHCAQPLLRAMQVKSSSRVSIAAYNDVADIDAFINGMTRAVEVLT